MSEALVVTSRAEEVFQQVQAIKTNLVGNLLQLGELLSEARRDNHAEAMGFEAFDQWLEASGLDMSERQAWYLIKIIDNAKSLGISREELAGSKISKLKEIFTLDPQTHGEQIKQLVAASKELKLDDIRSAVDKIKNVPEGERLTWRNFRVTEAQAETVDRAVGRAKLEGGQTIDTNTGEIMDISDGTAIELIAADYLAGPSYTQQVIGEPVVEIPVED